jgi:hypothetical protein
VSRFRLGLQIIGPLELLETFTALVEGSPYTLRRQGEGIGGFSRIPPAHVLFIDLAKWERPGIYAGDNREAILADERAQIAAATVRLEQLAPALASLDRSEIKASLWLSTIREEDQGGLGLPPELVAAAAAGALGFEISILVAFDPDDA